MADLFERLLARAAGGTSAVRPRREVSDVLFVGVGIDRGDDTSPEAPREDAAESVGRTPRQTRERPPQKRATEPTRLPRSEPPRTVAPPREEVAPRPSARAAAGEVRTWTGYPPAPHPPGLALAGVRIVRPADDAAARIEHETAPSRAEASAARPVTHPAAAAPAADARSRASAPPPASVLARAAPAPAPVGPAPDPPRSEREPSAEQHPPTRRQRTVSPPTAPAATAPPPSRAAEDRAPVIRISIGRVDVRATTPRAAAAPARNIEPAQPHLTLDAFLTRSSEGRR